MSLLRSVARIRDIEKILIEGYYRQNFMKDTPKLVVQLSKLFTYLNDEFFREIPSKNGIRLAGINKTIAFREPLTKSNRRRIRRRRFNKIRNKNETMDSNVCQILIHVLHQNQKLYTMFVQNGKK